MEHVGDCCRFGSVVLQADVDGGQNSARDGQQMRGELDLVRGEVKLLEQLAGVAMAEDGVGGEIVGRVHEVGLGGGGFAGAADSGLGVADDAVVEIDEAGLNEGSQGEDDGGGVAAGVGDEACVGDLVAVEFGAAVDGFGLEVGGVLGVGVVEFVDGAVGAVLQTPCAAEVDDLDAPLDGFGNPLAGLLVGSGEEEDLDAGVDDALPSEGEDLVGLWLPATASCGWRSSRRSAAVVSASPARPRNVGTVSRNLG